MRAWALGRCTWGMAGSSSAARDAASLWHAGDRLLDGPSGRLVHLFFFFFFLRVHLIVWPDDGERTEEVKGIIPVGLSGARLSHYAWFGRTTLACIEKGYVEWDEKTEDWKIHEHGEQRRLEWRNRNTGTLLRTRQWKHKDRSWTEWMDSIASSGYSFFRELSSPFVWHSLVCLFDSLPQKKNYVVGLISGGRVNLETGVGQYIIIL